MKTGTSSAALKIQFIYFILRHFYLFNKNAYVNKSETPTWDLSKYNYIGMSY